MGPLKKMTKQHKSRNLFGDFVLPVRSGLGGVELAVWRHRVGSGIYKTAFLNILCLPSARREWVSVYKEATTSISGVRPPTCCSGVCGAGGLSWSGDNKGYC